MSKNPNKLKIKFDLLHPQSNPTKLHVKIFKWLLSSGRYIFIFVEGLVLLAFLARFKLDADLTNLTESIDQQIPYIESLKPYETRIRQTQLQLSTISTITAGGANYNAVIQKIAAQTPQGVILNNLSLDKEGSVINIQISAKAQNNADVSTLLLGMKSDKYFTDVNLANISLEEGVVKFSINAKTPLNSGGV